MIAPRGPRRPVEGGVDASSAPPTPDALRAALRSLPPGQRRVVQAIARRPGATYPDLARGLGLHLGTLHTHLRRVREWEPALYAELLAIRRRALAARQAARWRAAA